jgi:hypothetical protein
MEVMMLDLFWDIRQQRAIEEVRFTAKNSERTANDTWRHVVRLEERVDRLTLITAALWSLLQRTSGLTDAELQAKVQQIDLTDGRLDGKLRPDVRNCAACGRPMAARHIRCVYCGEDAEHKSAFDPVTG